MKYVVVASIVVLIAALIEAILLGRTEEGRPSPIRRGVLNAILMTILTFVAGLVGWMFGDILWVTVLIEIVMILAIVIPVRMALDDNGAATVPEHFWLLVIALVFTWVARKQAMYATSMTTVFWGSVLRTLPWLAFIVTIGYLCHNYFLTKEMEDDNGSGPEEEPAEEEPEEEPAEEEETEEEDEYDEGGE